MVQLGAPITLGSIIFGQSIGASGFNITGDGTAGSNSLTLAGTAAIAVNVSGTDTISAVIAGSNGLNFSSTTNGRLNLTGANTYSGTTTISSGTLSIFADANLGNAGNDITFNGSAAAGLMLNAPMVLGSGRTITLNNTGGAVALLSSNGTAAQVVLGQVTGAGTLAVANAGTTYLLNTANNATGILWAQTGTVSLSTLTDASGNGNIKLGSGTSTGGVQWNVGATSALNLSNRSIELAGTTGGGTIDSSSLVAANSITINNNLLFTAAASGAKTLTLTGFNQGINTFAGNILNNGSSTTALQKSGADLWVLTGTGNNYTGALTINQGTLRVVNASGLGGTGTLSFGGAANGQGLDIRTDTAPTGIRSINNNSATNAFIYLDHAATNGNATTGQTITFGTIAQANNTAAITFVGNHGYGVALGVNTLAASNGTANTLTTYTITNDLGSPGLTGYSVGANEFISIAGFAESGSNTAGVTQTLNGWGNYTITGTISNTSTQPVNLTKSGSGVLTYSPTTLSGWNTGTLTLSGGITRIASSIATGGATVTLGAALIELRNNGSTNFGFNVANVSSTSTLFIDHALGGTTTAQTATIGTLTLNTAATLNVVGDHGYSLVTGLVAQKGTISSGIANYLAAPGYAGYTGGTVTLGGITTDTTAGVATLTLAGFGDFILGGTVSSPTAGVSLNITKTTLGVVTFGGNNSGWTNATQGILNANGGTTLIDTTNTNAVGSTNLTGTAGMLGILGASGTSGATWTGKNLVAAGAFTLVADPLAGSSATGQTVNLGGYTGGSTMIVDSNHGYGITFNAAGTTGASSTVTNVGNGAVTFAGGLTTTGAFTWTLNGPGDYNVSGNITNGTGTTALTKSGYGTTTLGGTNTIGGTLTFTGGILRVTNAGAFGGAGTITVQGGNNNAVGSSGFDFRNDSGMDLSSRVATATGAGYNYAINVDRAIGGSGTNQTISIGGGAWAGATSAGWGYTVTGANGYSLQYKGTALTVIQGMAAPTINNFIANISGNGSIIFNSGITFTNTTTANGIVLGGTGEYLLSGALTSQAGTTTAATVTKSGTGAVTISNDNSSTWNSVLNNEVITVSAGILRLTNGGGLGGSNAVYNQNGGVLDLRSDAGITQTGPVITVGATSTINVDRAIGGTGTGGTQTITSLKDNGVFSVYTTGGTQSGGNAYNLAINTFTVGGAGTAATPTLINTIGSGGVLRIGTLAGGAGFNVVVNGSGNTNVITAMTANTGTLTKSGTGTLTIGGPAGYAATNTNGAVTINGGNLTLDFTGITAPTNLLQSAALTLGAASAGGVSGGTLTIKAAASGATAQTLTTLALAAGQDNITMIAGGTSNTLTFSGAITATNAGSTALITAPATTSVSVATALNTAATTGRNLVFFDGTNYNWATNTASGAAFIANNNAASAAAVKYAPLLLTAGTDTANSQITASGTTSLGGARITNSLMINTGGAGGTLALGANMLTLTQGGILFTDSTAYFITGTSAANGLKSAIATNSDVVINNYGTGLLNIQAPIIQGAGTSTLTLGGTGTTVLGNSAVLTTVGTYTGITYINSGTVVLAAGIVGLGASNTALTQNGGTFDLNGNNVVIGSFNGGPAAVVDNNPTVSTAASLTIGAGNGTGTFNGTIKDTKGALTVIKSGTGAITLGDAVTGGSNLFTGDLRFTGASTLTLNSLADTAGAKVDFNVTGATLKFAGRSNLTLNSRVFDISAAGGSATIDSSSTAGSINGTNAVMTIGSAFAPTGSGALSLTLQGSAGNIANGGTGSGAGDGISGITGSGNVAVVNAFTGAIGNGTGGGTVALTIAGAGGWSLGGNNTYSGGTTISSTGLVRATSGTAFGSGTVNVTGTGTLDLRSDSSLTFANGFTMNGSFTINVDRAIGGSGYGQIMNIGMLTEATGGKTLTVNNLTGASTQTGSGVINGYGLHIAGLALTNGSATTIQNSMGSSGAAEFVIPVAGTGVAGALVIDGVAATAGLGSHTLTFGSANSNNFGVTVINGDITQGVGTTLGITVAGGTGNAQFITLAGQTAATNYSGGLIFNVGSGLATVRVTNAYALGSGAVSFTGTVGAATLEVRSDTSLTFANNITLGNTTTARTNLLTVGEALNGSSSRNNTFTFGTVGFQGITANALTVSGIGGSTDNSGDSVTFGGVSLGNGSLNGTAGFTITNSLLLPGVLNLGNVTSTNTTAGTTQTLTIAGAGVTTMGNVTDSATATALTAINFTGTGVLDLSGATSANLYSGGLTLTGGTARVTNAFGLGASSNVVNFIGGLLELRSDTNVSYTNQMLLNATGSGSLNVGQLPGGTGVNGATGVMFTLGQLKVGTTGKAFAVNGIGGSLATSADSVTLGGVDLNGIAATTITNNLQLPGMLNVGNVSSTAAGAAVLTFNGSGVTLVGDVTNGSSTSVGLSFTGTSILDLSRMTAATNYSGGLTINTATSAALVRITDAFQLGTAAGISLGGGTLEIRRDADFTYAGALNWNANSGTVNINVGEVGTGTTTGMGKTFSFGTLTVTTASGKTLAFGGIGSTGASSSDSVVVNNVIFGAGNLSNTISNNLALPGTLNLGNITGNGTTGTVTLTIGGNGFTMIGDVSNGSGGSLTALTYSGTGILQITPTASAATNYTGGLNLTGNGIMRIFTNATAANFGGAGGVITLTGGSGSTGTLDIRTDTGLSVANAIAVVTNSVTINVDAATSGNLGKTVTFDGAATSLTPVAAKTLTLTSGSNYGMTFTNGFSVNFAGYTIANNASGTVNLGALSYTVASGSLILGGSGYTTVGSISGTSGTNLPALTFSGTGFLDLTGNNAASNQISAVTLSGAGGILKVNSATNLGATGDIVSFTSTTTAATLQVRSDNGGTSNDTILFGNNIALNVNNALGIIDVGNAGVLAVTGNTVAFGALTNSTTANSIGTLTINGANGYGVSFTSIALSSGTTGVATTLVANAPVTITGGVTNAMTVTATKGDTLVLDGVSTGTIAGTIADATGGSLAAGGFTAITKQGTGTWTLSGTNTNEGATTVNNGTLLINGSSAANNAYTVNGSATQGLQGTLGGTGTIGGAVTLATNGATAFGLGAVLNPGTVGTAGTLTITGSLTTNDFTNLNFDLNTATTVGGAVNDLISTAVAPTFGATTQVNINALGTLGTGSYTLINGYSGTISTFSNLNLNTVFAGDTTHSGVLRNSAGALQLFITNPTPLTAYWNGSIDGNWDTLGSGATTNWRDAVTGGADTLALPGSTTDVHFYTSTAGNFTTSLGAQGFSIKTLTFDAAATSAVSINDNTLTLTPTSGTTGLTVASGAGAVTINSAVSLGAAQTWTNNAANTLTIAGNVDNNANLLIIDGTGNTTISGIYGPGSGGITKNGAGTLTLSGASTFTGSVILNAGTLVAANNAGALGTGASTLSLAGGSLSLTNASGTNLSFSRNTTVSANMTLTSDVNVASTAGNTYTLGTLSIGAQTLTVAGGGNVNSGTAGVTFGTTTLTGNTTFSVTNPTNGGSTVLTLGALADGGTARTISKTGGGTLILNAVASSLVTGTVINLSDGVLISNVAGALSQVATTANTTTVNVTGTGELRGTVTGSFRSSGTSTPSEQINLNGGTVRLSNAATTTFGGNLTYSSGSLILDRTASGTANSDTMGTLSIGSATLTPTTANYTTIPTLIFGATTLTGNPVFDTTNANITVGALADGGTARTITKQGANTLTLSTAASSLVDGTSVLITGGTLNSNVAAALGTLAAVNVSSGATLGIVVSQQIGSLAGAGSVNITAAQTLTVGSTTNNLSGTTFSGATAATTGILKKDGTGTWTLSGTNLHTGGTTLVAGTLIAKNVQALGNGGTLTLTSGILDLQTDTSVNAYNTTVNGNVTIQSDKATASSAGITHTLGTLSINGSTLSITAGANVSGGAPAIAFGAATLTGAATFNVASGVALNLTSTLTTTTNALTLAGGGQTTISGVVTSTVAAGNVAINVGNGAGSGSILSMTNTGNAIAGDISINGGLLIYTQGTATTTSQLGVGSGSVFRQILISNGGTFQVSTVDFNVNVVSTTNKGAGFVFNIGSGGGTFLVDAGRTFTIDDGSVTGTGLTAYELQGTGNLTKSGTGTLILRNQNSYSGTITISAGTLKASGTTMATSAAGITIQSGAALDLSGQAITDAETLTIAGTGLTAAPVGVITNSSGTAASYAGSVILGGDSSIGGTGAITIAGAVTETGGSRALTKVGAGTLTLSSVSNAYSGALNITAGTLSVASLGDSGTGSNGTGTITFNNAAATAGLTYTGSGATLTRGITLSGSGGAITLSNTGTGALNLNGAFTNSTTGSTALTLNATNAGANTLTGNLVDNGANVLSVTKTGAGTWVLSGTNTYSGATSITTGVLQFNGAAALPSATAITLGGGTLSYHDDASGSIDRTANTLSLTATSTIDVGNNGGTTTGSVVRFGALSQTGATARTLNITGANGYTVELAGLALATSTGQTTTLNPTTANLSITGNVTNGMSGFTTTQFDTVVLSGTTTGNSISGVISDAAGGSFLPTVAGGYTKITQNGGSMWRLSGQNTNTGAVAVQNGAIWLAGGDNRLNPNGGGVTLGTGTTSGKLIIGGNADGTTTAGSQRSQTLNQINATSILATSGTGTLNSVVGGADGGTSAGTPANNSTLTLNIGAGFTDTYAGLIGWDGTGSVGFQNNINLVKSGAGTLILTGDLTNWTGTQTNTAEGMDLTIDVTRPTITISGGVLRATGVINTVVLQTGGIFDDQTTSHGVNFYLKITGGLVTSNALTDNAEDVVETISHGVYAFNFNNTGTTGVSGSDMYLGAVGARIFSGSALAAGSSNTYRFGGGAPWGAVSTATLGGSGGYLQIATVNVVTGANNVIIGDNGSYGGGLGIYGGNSTVEFTAAQNYTGTTTLAGGTLVVSNSNQLGTPTTVAGSIILDGGILRYSGITTDFSNRITIASGGTIDTNGQNVTFATALANSNTGTSGLSNGGLTKIGTGTLTLTAASTYSGTTTVSGGTLQLNRQTGSLNTSSALNIAGNGTFRFDNTGALGGLSQALASLTFSVGDGVILSQRTAAQSTTLTFQTMATRVAGATGNFTVAGTGSSASVDQVVFSTPPATNQFLNAGLYFGGTDFAVYDATSAGYVRAINYTTDTNVGISAGGATLGATVTGKDLQLGTAAVSAQTTVSINSLKIAGAFGITLGSGQTLTIASGGLIKTGATATITGGTLATSGELVIRLDASGDALTIASVISSGTGIAGNVALTKSGLGTLTLSTATSAINGQIVINGGTITVDNVSRIAGSSGITLNGGNFTISGNSTINRVFTLGLNGGTITQSSTGQDNTIGTAGDVMQFVGMGARTLTLVGGDTRVKTFAFSIGDNGGPTSLVIAGSGDNSVYRLSGANTYTGTTTITRGVLRIAATTDLPGGLGGAVLTTSNTGGGNLVFNGGSSTNRAILEVTSAGGDIYRSVGTGIDQIQWLGNGGFSNQTANTTRIVNLGGAGATLTWGSGGFVPTGSRLQLSQAGANVAAAGTVDFQNGINFGTAVRTLDVANGSAIVDAILSGNLTFGAGGGFTMTTGIGALSLTGTNNTGAVPVSITGGLLYFANANAILGSSGTITVTHGVSAPAAIGMAGSTNPLLFWNSRLAPSSNGGFALDVNSSDNLDFSTGNVTNMRLTAFNPANTAVYYTGTLTPSGTTYRFGGVAPGVSSNAPSTTLVLSNKNTLTGARSVDLAPGNLTLIAAQNYTGGTVVNTSVAGSSTSVGVGSDAAFGSGTVNVGGANTVAFGAVNGDRVVANRVLDSQTAAVAFVVAGDQASDGIANNTNQGAITYAGTLDLNARAASAVLHIRTGHVAIFLGNISNSTNGITLNSSTSSLFSILSTPGNGGVAKTFSGGTILGDGTTLTIDGDSSLGGSGGLTMNGSTLILQPGSGSVALNRTLTFSADDSQVIAVGVGGALTFSGAVSGSTGTSAARTFSKNGAGLLILQGSNGTYTGNATFSNTLQILGGGLQLDASNFTAASDRFFSDSATLLPVVFGAASATLGGGGTLEIVEAASKSFALTQGFGNLTINQGAHTITLTNNNVTQALNLNLGSTFTRAALNGGTLNFTSTTAGGINTIGSAIANNAGGIIGGYATFNGLDWAVQSGSNTITALASGSYTTLVAASNSTTGNFILTTGTVALSTASASLNTLKLVGSAGGTNVTLNGTNALTSGGVIFDNTLGSASISGGQLGATGAEVIIFTGGTGSNSTNKLTLTAVIKGTATALTKSGSGTLVLAGANTYTGSLIINAGTVEFSNGAASQNLGGPTAGATNIILNGGVLRATATTSLIYGITINGPAAIDLGSGVTLSQTAQGITGISSATGLNTGLLQKTGLGTLTLAGTTANSNLSIEIVGGVLNLGKTAVLALGETTNSNGVPYAALIVDSGAVANLTGTGGNQIGDASSVVVKSGGVFDVMGTGATVTTESFDGLAGTGTVRNTIGTLFTLTLGSNNSSNLAPYTLGAAAAGVGSTGLNNFGGVIQGNIALNKIGSGTQILSGNNTYSGSTTINEGTLKLGTTNALPSGAGKGDVTLIGDSTATGVAIGGSATVLAPGTLDLGGYNQAINGLNSTTGGFVTNNPTAGASITNTLTVGSGDANGAFNGVIMDGYSVGADSTTAAPLAYLGTINLSKIGSGTQVLSGVNTFTGKTSVTGGVLSISADYNLGTAPGSNVDDQLTLDGGTLQTTATLTIASTRRITVGTSGGTFDTAATTTATINSVILGGGPITKIGAGTLVFTAANTYTGKTSIQQGAVSVSSINSVAGGTAGSNLGAPVTAANGTLDMGATTTTGALIYTGAGETTDRVVNLAGTTGGGTLDQSGTGVVKFTSDLTATGAGSKVLTLQGSTAGTGEISGAIVDNSVTNTTGVTKNGTGTWVLSGTNTYTGATTVNGGTLQVGASGTGSIGNSAVTVNSTATLSGSGSIAGSTVIGSGGVLAPGDGNPDTSNATLTFSAATTSLTVADTGSIHLSLTSADSTDTGFAAWFHANPGGTAADYVTSVGGIANTGAGTSWNDIHSGSHDFISAADTIVLGSTNTTDKRVVVSLNNLNGVTYGSVFNLMDWSTLGLTHDDSALSAMGAFNVANNLQLQDISSISPGLAWDTSLFDSYGIIVVVPEPGRLLFLMLGLLGLLARRRRRAVA